MISQLPDAPPLALQERHGRIIFVATYYLFCRRKGNDFHTSYTPGTLRLDVFRGFRYNMSWEARVKRLILPKLARLFHSGGGAIVLIPFGRGGDTWFPYPMY